MTVVAVCIIYLPYFALESPVYMLLVEAQFTVPIIAGVSVGVFIAISVLVALLFWYWYRPLDLSSLPKDVRWFYEKYQQSPRSWEVIGT